MGLGWGVAYQVFFAKADVDVKYGQLLFWGIFFSSWIGSKLFFYLTNQAIHSDNILTQASFWTGGGFVFYGGLIFVLIFLGLYKLLHFPLTMRTFWAMLPAVTLGHAIGRVGCLLAGCCYGKETNMWWGIKLHGSHRHPTQILESLGLFLIALILIKAKPSFKSFALYFIGYGVLRFGIEILRGDTIRGTWGVLTPSQWISFGLIFLGTGIILINKIKLLGERRPN
jgi:phosphatidylglycerol:prolipoprotein diacylglycerol transferase